MLLLSRDEVRRSLDLDALIVDLADAMADVSAGVASVPGRIAASLPDGKSRLVVMPGYAPTGELLASKIVSVFPANSTQGMPTHQGVVAVFDATSGGLVAVMDGSEITAIRTGACSALSTRLLAREDASVLAVLGLGPQAFAHVRAMARVRPITEIRLSGRSVDRARKAADSLRAELPGVVVTGVGSNREAVEGADVVCAATSATEPVLQREWLAEGAHVTSIGYSPSGRELDDETLAAASIYVESREAALAPAPVGSSDLTDTLRRGVIVPGQIRAELGELVSGSDKGRSSPHELTLFKSVGLATHDAAAAAVVLRAARASRLGTEFQF